MTRELTADARSALSRARFFLEKAKACSIAEQVEFEAYLEAAIVFARTSLLRFKTEHQHHPDWNSWWVPLRRDPTIVFFQTERNIIVHEASPKIGQRIFAPSIGAKRATHEPALAQELYYFESTEPATDTIERHLRNTEQILRDAEPRFS